jgi:hypothetical protein
MILSPLRDQLLDLERRLADPVLRRDPSALAHLLAEDFIEYGSSGQVFDREQTLAALPRAQPRVYAIEDYDVRELGPGWALARYRATTAGASSLRSSIWLRRDGAWKIVFHQGTPVAGGR